jgi:hypothetical protein
MASSDPPPTGDREVLSSLPNARPQRRSAKRDAKPAAPKAEATAAKPRATATPPAVEPAPKAPIPPAGYATPRGGDEGPSPTDVVTTAVQAVGELAQIGIVLGARALKSAVQRLPRP